MKIPESPTLHSDLAQSMARDVFIGQQPPMRVEGGYAHPRNAFFPAPTHHQQLPIMTVDWNSGGIPRTPVNSMALHAHGTIAAPQLVAPVPQRLLHQHMFAPQQVHRNRPMQQTFRQQGVLKQPATSKGRHN